jgi:uncharacterized iron-regulated protein
MTGWIVKIKSGEPLGGSTGAWGGIWPADGVARDAPHGAGCTRRALGLLASAIAEPHLRRFSAALPLGGDPLRRLLLAAACLASIACSGADSLRLAGVPTAFPAGVIVATADARAVAFDEMLAELARVRVIYVGERHNQMQHHDHQLAVIQALRPLVPHLKIGLEMVDHSYQAVLDRWVQGEFDMAQLRRLTHWEANWGFDLSLYGGILEYARQQRIPLVALNLPFHIPPKIAIGGVNSLGAEDAAHLPQHIDFERADHRLYVEGIFRLHRGMQQAERTFEDFYAAQCVWEDTMAEAVARHLGRATMVVLAGNGHIQKGFGIPLRAAARGASPFRSVVQLPAGASAERADADFIWVSPP